MRTESGPNRAVVITALLALPCVMFNCSAKNQLAVGTTESPHGARLLEPFKHDLMHALKTGLDSGGPLEAMTACNLQAPAIASSNSSGGVKVGRSSTRLRNPSNAPSDWVQPVLDEYVNNPAKREQRTVELEDGRHGYIEPIYIKPMCLQCHGDEISDDVSAKLAALYPDDAATGYTAGEFRGVFWVEYAGE